MAALFNGEHDVLVGHAARLTRALEQASEHLAPRRVDRLQHREFAERAALLAEHLRAALDLAVSDRYPPALAIVRTALEHHLLDRLVFLGTRYTRSYVIPADKRETEEQRLRDVKSKRSDLLRWRFFERKKQKQFDVVLTFSGYHADDRIGKSPTISQYYFLLDEYDPLAGKSSVLQHVVAPFRDLDALKRWSKESQELWERFFKPQRVLANLRLNRLLTVPQAVQVEVHYSFLSTFVHPTQAAYDLAYGHSRPSRRGRYDHYLSELVLLYVIAIGAEELAVFARGCRRPPAVTLRDWTEVAAATSAALAATDYFWFLHGHPTMYDRIGEVHTRVDPQRLARGKAKLHDPAAVATVRYYANPLRRLVDLHASSREMTTGLTYISPWPRDDANRRR